MGADGSGYRKLVFTIQGRKTIIGFGAVGGGGGVLHGRHADAASGRCYSGLARLG